MAFVFKAERSDSLNSHRITPAPGQYLGPSDYRFEQNPAPFLTNSVRMPDNSHTVDLPELEPHVIIIKNSVRGDHNRQVMRSNHAQVPNTARPSANFQSKIERFNEPLRDIPGPGSYSRNSRMGKRYNMPPLDSSRGQASQRVLPRNKSVPSIPSQIHSHGYCEGPEGDLVLNEHPIEETQQLPGARCHEMKDGQNQLQNVKKVKGAPWSKSSEKTVQSYIPKVATIDMVGPGTYEAQERGSLSNRRPSCGFESKVERNCSIKIRRSVSTTRMRPSYHPALPLNHLSETVRQAGEEEDESGEYEEYVKDCTPGPGYYYNASTASSFYSKATSIRSRKSEGEGAKELAIGSNTERFKEFVGAAGDLGPGAYEIKRDLNKKEMSYKKIPFRTSDLRFEKVKISNDLGPGAYQIQVKMGKDFSNKTKKAGEESMIEGLPGSKIRIEDVLSDNKRMMKNKTPGPGDYNPKVMSEIGNSVKDERESYSFASRLRREVMKPNTDIPPVGSYNVNQLDIATKVIKEEDDLDELGPKKPAFNSSNPRFKGNNTLEDSDDDEEVNWKPRQDLASVLKAQKPPKKSVMFASKVKRMEGDETKTLIPGPGSYHNVKQSDWTKQTFNVNFSNANFT